MCKIIINNKSDLSDIAAIFLVGEGLKRDKLNIDNKYSHFDIINFKNEYNRK